MLVCVVLAIQTWAKAHRHGGYDLTSYLLSARALLEGRSPYSPETPFPYVYPMLLAFALIPWLLLPYDAAVLAWFAASVAALGALLWTATDRREITVAATAAISFAAIQNTLLNGQVNFFVVLCCVLSVAAGRERRDLSAGAWLGAGIALKLMPAVLGMYFLVRGRALAIAVAAVTALVLSLAPALLLGNAAWEAYAEYAREFLLPVVRESPAAREARLVFSVPGVVHAWFGAAAPRWVLPASALAVIVAVTAADVLRWRPRGQDLAAGAGYMLAIVLISPMSEVHHLAFAIPAIGLCCTWWLNGAVRSAVGITPTVLASALLVLAPLGGAAQGTMICAALVLFGVALAALTPSSALPQGSPRWSWSSPSDPAAAP